MRLFLWFAVPLLLGIWLYGAIVHGWGDDPLIVLVIFVLLVTPLARRGARPPDEFHDAPIAVGTVVSATRTGRMVRDHPELDIQVQVHTADGRSFPATTRRPVVAGELPAVQPDTQLPVRYLADGRVMVAWDASDQEIRAAIDRVNVAREWF